MLIINVSDSSMQKLFSNLIVLFTAYVYIKRLATNIKQRKVLSKFEVIFIM